MAIKIPQYDGRLTPSTGGVQSRASGVPATGDTARALQGLGQAGQQAVDMWQKGLDAQAVTSVQSAMLQAQDHWEQQVTDLAGKTQNGGMLVDEKGQQVGLADKITGDMGKWASDYLAKVDNPRARIYAQRVVEQLQYQVGQMARATQHKALASFTVDTASEMIKAGANDAMRDPSLADAALTKVKTFIANGVLSEDARFNIYQQAHLEIDNAAAMGAIERDPLGAGAAFRRRLNAEQPKQTAAAMPTPDEAWGRMTNKESGNKQFGADGKPLTSPKNAIGAAQVRLTTGPEAAALAGVPWDENKFKTDKAYNLQLGRAYFDQQLKNFGSVDKAAAAYNMGPGSDTSEKGLRHLLRKYGDNWLQHAPKETQDYVKAVVGSGVANVADVAVATPPSTPFDAVVARLPADRIPGYINAATSEAERQSAVLKTSVLAKMTNDATAWKNGETVQTPLAREQVVAAFGPIEGEDRYRNYLAAQTMGGDLKNLKTLPNSKVAALVESYRPKDPNAPDYAVADERYRLMAQAAAESVKARQEDPIAYAQQAKIANVQDIKWDKPQEAAAELALRAGAADTMVRDYGAKSRVLLSANEATALAHSLSVMPADSKLGFLYQMKQAAGSDINYMSILSQIAPNHPAIAVAGVIGSMPALAPVGGGMFSSGKSYSPQITARLMLRGDALLNPNAETATTAGSKNIMPMPKDADMQAQFDAYVGDAFRNGGSDYRVAYESVKAYYAGKSDQVGDQKGIIDGNRFREALQAVIGPVADLNGKVMPPLGMDADYFEHALENVFEQQMVATKMKDGQFDAFDKYSWEKRGTTTYVALTPTGYLLNFNARPDANGRYPVLLFDVSKAKLPATIKPSLTQLMAIGAQSLSGTPVDMQYLPAPNIPDVPTQRPPLK